MGPSSRRSPVDGKESIQERVPGMRGFETWRGPKVVGGRIHAFAARKCGDDFRGPVAKPERRHLDQGAVLGLEREAKVELQNSVRSQERPVRPAGQHLSAQPRAFEVAARDRRNHPRTVGNGADLLRSGHRDLQRHQQA
jgi:hypothetical protein